MVKAIVVLLIGLILLGGAAFGGWTIYQKYFEPPHEEAPPPPPPLPATAFLRMSSIVVPIIAKDPATGRDKVEQFVTFVATVEVVETELVKAQGMKVIIQDRLFRELYGAADERKIMRGNLVDLEEVKKVMKAAAIKVLGPDAVRDVLLQVVTQRHL